MRSVRPHMLSSAAMVSLLAGLASANPVPWINLGIPVNSRGLYGDVNNTVLITPSIPAGGPFTYMTISGTLTAVAGSTYPTEACIEVNTPSGQSFVVKPFTATSFSGVTPVPAGSVTIPLAGSFGSGSGTLRFFELFADSATGSDSTWNNLQITLHNAAGGDATPMDAIIGPTGDGPDVSSILQVPLVKGAAPGAVLGFATNRVVGKVHMRGFGTCIGGWNVSSSFSQLSFVKVNITAPKADGSGPVTWTVFPFANYAASSTQYDLVSNTPVPVKTGPGNDWSFTVTETGAPAVAGANLAMMQMSFQPLPPDAPSTADLGTIRSRPALGPEATTVVNTVNATVPVAGVKWYTFTTEHPASDASGFWLDIHTQEVAGSLVTDHEIGLYDSTGHRIINDDDSGSGLLSMLSFGQTSPVRPEIAPIDFPSPRNGFSGPLAPGLHYLAVGEFNTFFADTGWFTWGNGANTGAAAVEFRTNLPPLIPPFTDLGTIRINSPVSVPVSVAANEVKWFRFDTPAPIDNITRYYLDIDTIPPGSAPFTDTMIGLYSDRGVLVTYDDDDGRNGNRSQLTFGIGPSNRLPIGDSLAGDGRDGNLAAGRYYLATGLYGSFGMTFLPEWNVTSTGAAASFPLNFRTNFPTLGCGPADIGAAGGVPGADGQLNNNDFVVFIDYFFNHNPLADVGSTGGVAGADGQWNNNDFVVFINQFFNGCP